MATIYRAHCAVIFAVARLSLFSPNNRLRRQHLLWASCSLHPGPGFTQPSILSWSVNEYRLRMRRYKAGMCDASWCAPCTWVPLRRAVPTKGRYNKCSTFTFTFTLTRSSATAEKQRVSCPHGNHTQGALRGHLCGSSAVLFSPNNRLQR